MSEGSEQIDQDGSSVLEALYEQYAATDHKGQASAHADEQEESQDGEEPLEDEEEPEDGEEPLEDEGEPADEGGEPADQEEKKPRRSRQAPGQEEVTQAPPSGATARCAAAAMSGRREAF